MWVELWVECGKVVAKPLNWALASLPALNWAGILMHLQMHTHLLQRLFNLFGQFWSFPRFLLTPSSQCRKQQLCGAAAEAFKLPSKSFVASTALLPSSQQQRQAKGFASQVHRSKIDNSACENIRSIPKEEGKDAIFYVIYYLKIFESTEHYFRYWTNLGSIGSLLTGKQHMRTVQIRFISPFCRNVEL